jgi:hypothetical protein
LADFDENRRHQQSIMMVEKNSEASKTEGLEKIANGAPSSR